MLLEELDEVLLDDELLDDELLEVEVEEMEVVAWPDGKAQLHRENFSADRHPIPLGNRKHETTNIHQLVADNDVVDLVVVNDVVLETDVVVVTVVVTFVVLVNDVDVGGPVDEVDLVHNKHQS